MLLITGGSGFVGHNLARYFAPRRRTVSTYFTHQPLSSQGPAIHLDVTDGGMVSSVFNRERPEVVIHAAGNKNVKFCEQHPDLAHAVNAAGTQNVARACREIGATLIYVSTDLVFSSQEGNYREDDLPKPTLAYGQSKLDGEKLAAEEWDQVAICRSGGIYGRDSPLLKWVTEEINAGKTVDCFTDIFNTPTYVYNFAEMIESILEKKLFGRFHTVGRERVSRFQFFLEYAKTFDLNVNLVAPVSSAETRDLLLLQPDSSLSSERTAKKLEMKFNSVSEGFRRLRDDGGA